MRERQIEIQTDIHKNYYISKQIHLAEHHECFQAALVPGSIINFSTGQRPADPWVSSTGLNYIKQLDLNFLSRRTETSSHTFRTSGICSKPAQHDRQELSSRGNGDLIILSHYINQQASTKLCSPTRNIPLNPDQRSMQMTSTLPPTMRFPRVPMFRVTTSHAPRVSVGGLASLI